MSKITSDEFWDKGLECAKCHNKEKFTNPGMAQIFGWKQVNYEWYCPNCGFGGEK